MTRGLGFLALLGLMVLALGCSCPPYPNLVQDYGRSVTNNTAVQVVNPQAGLTNVPAPGLGPQAATNLKGKYDKTFKAEEGKAMMQITTGGGI